MISPAFLKASMVGFHVEFSQSMYSSKCPYSTCTSSTSVTGPSVYWRSSWARALSESEEAARHVDKIMVLIIFSSPGLICPYSANTRINLTFLRRAPQRVPGRQPSSLLGFAELQDELVGVSANRLVEHFGRARVRRIGENQTLGVELESRGFDFSAHG